MAYVLMILNELGTKAIQPNSTQYENNWWADLQGTKY